MVLSKMFTGLSLDFLLFVIIVIILFVLCIKLSSDLYYQQPNLSIYPRQQLANYVLLQLFTNFFSQRPLL